MIVYLKECFEEVSVGKPADNIYISHTHISKQTNYTQQKKVKEISEKHVT